MIQASELRIGNWYNEFGLPKKVTGGFIQRLSHIQSLTKVAIDVSGIPLTPEILEKAGFEKSESDFWVKDGKPSFQWGKGNDDDWFITYQTAYGLDWNDAYHVITLHQLQNLYFALTGEELEINL